MGFGTPCRYPVADIVSSGCLRFGQHYHPSGGRERSIQEFDADSHNPLFCLCKCSSPGLWFLVWLVFFPQWLASDGDGAGYHIRLCGSVLGLLLFTESGGEADE